MKALRFVLLLVFIFTLAVSPAQAKAGERYGFIPLLTKVNPTMPLRVQARDAFQRMLPKLRAAQKSGAILEFAPEFGAGVLKIKYAARTGALKLGNTQVLDDINAAAALVPHSRTARVRPEALTPTFYPYLYESCFDGNGLGSDSHVVASLRDTTGTIVNNYEGDADANGDIWGCFYSASGPYSSILPGYKVTFKIYDSTGATVLGTFPGTAPNIAVTSLNKGTSVVGGNGPINKPYYVVWSHLNLDAGNTCGCQTLAGTIGADYKWQLDFGTTPFRGEDTFTVGVTQNANFIFERAFDVPYAYCELDNNYCDVYGFPFQTATMTIVHAGVPYTFTGKYNSWGWFGGELEDAAGNPISIAPGDTVSGGPWVPVYTLPDFTAVPNYTTNFVTGTAPINRFFWIEVLDVYTGAWYDIWTHSNPSGVFSANFNAYIDLKPEYALTLITYYKDPTTGNHVDRYMPVGP